MSLVSAMRRIRLVAACWALWAVAGWPAAAPATAASQRVALVIGNANYANRPLPNPMNDAADLAAALRAAGFEVMERRNRTADELRRDLIDFQDKLGPGKTGLFYFAGHGLQAGRGLNYLLPVGVDYKRERDAELYGLEVGSVLRRMEESGASLNLVILDACRDSPLPAESRSVHGRGLGRMDAPSGSLIAFATAPGSIADDNPSGRNGLYTQHLLDAIKTPGLRLEDVFKRVRRGVEKDSGRRQSPEEISKLTSDEPFYFLGLGGTAPAEPQGSVLVKIGHVGPTSGAIAHLGKDNENGARMAIDELNARGVVIGGRRARFELLAEDDGGNPRTGTTAALRLVAANVNGVVGHLNSGTSIPASKVYSDAGIPQISPSATNPLFTQQGFKTAFRIIADDVSLGEMLARYAVKNLGLRRIAVIDDRTAYGQGIADVFERRAKVEGATLVKREFTNDKATDFTAILSSIKGASPDVIFYGGMDAVAGPMLRQMQQLGIKARFIGGDGICSGELPRLANGALADGQVICAEAGGVENALKPGMDRFEQDFKKKFGVDVQIYAPYTYDATLLLADAMVRAGSSEPARYLPYLTRTTTYQGITGPISFDEKGDIKRAALTLYTYRGGRKEQSAVVR